jgi:glyoxylase-like metal-dependent hydrolase (beta-lactamase superfamily II)
MKKQNDWFTVEKINNSTIVISEYGHYEETHSYLLIGNCRSLLIDTGLGIANIHDIIQNYVDCNELDVISTHAHWDHIGGHKYFTNRFVHKNEKTWLVNKFPLTKEIINRNFEDKCFKKGKPEWFNIDEYKVFNCDDINEVDDGYKFELGNRTIECVFTPGHSPGHLCLLDKTNNLLFSGDNIYYGTIFLNYPTTDPVAYYNSMQRIIKLKNEFNIIFPAHHKLEIEKDVIDELATLLEEVIKNKNLKHGSGIVKGERISLSL